MRTWGQIRFQLAKTAPGLDLELLNEFILGTYVEILNSREWQGLRHKLLIEVQAPYLEGTVELTQGSVDVTGTGTTWTAEMDGWRFRIPGQAEWYTFTFVDATTGTLDHAYVGETDAEATYSLAKAEYWLPLQVKYVVGVKDLTHDRELVEFRESELDGVSPSRTTNGRPRFWALSADRPDGLHTIEFYPVPDQALTVEVRYIEAPEAFNGSNTSDRPLNFIDSEVILAGARRRIAQHYAKDNPAAWLPLVQSYDADYQRMLAGLHTAENARVKPSRLIMHPAFTRHRARRYLR